MLGLMQSHPLLVSSLIEHASRSHPDTEVVSRTREGSVHRCTFADIGWRSKRVADALTCLGVEPGQRVGTLAWNNYRHLELFFGVSGMGAVIHTVNPRLFPSQLEYIINHAEDQYLFFDLCFLPLLEQIAPQLTTVKAFIAMADRDSMPPSAIANVLCYEDFVAPSSCEYRWPQLDENAASSLCYTSGTTGNPKGVLYTHRSTVLHAMLICTTDGIALSTLDSVLLASPMFHVNAWGIPYAAALIGARLLLPGPALDGASIYQAMRDEKATIAAGVPTVWLMLHQYVQTKGLRPRDDLALERVLVGGAAVPRAVVETFERDFGARVVHAWGMTETSPIATVCNPLKKHQDATQSQRIDLQRQQGRVPYGVELKITDDQGTVLPHDGTSAGHLWVRGHWIASAYFGAEAGSSLDRDGWFDTGDIATIDPDGYMHITDRAKDVIKSGGEWISSIDLENAAVGHACVAEAAAIGLPHPLWQERPLLVVVRKAGRDVTREELLAYLADKVAKWWLPNDIVFVTELPHTATGKLQKRALRETFADYRFEA
ncbi:MAG: 3-(methylthio)propionyl---CoA ligase [Gammaproteobacteria bacterium]|nr:3-(methylthio)propionyl---CoA ligase [Gammaproteobacteria bacterium]